MKEIRESAIRERYVRKPGTCGLSTVRTYKYLNFNGFLHAGTIAHVCSLPIGHKDGDQKKCLCACGIEFYGWN